MARRAGLVLGSLAAVTVSLGTQAAMAAQCAQAVIVGGDTCESLVVRIDAKACGDGGGDATLACAKDGAVATLQTKNAVYKTTITRGKESWGKRDWEVGAVRTKRLTASKTRLDKLTTRDATPSRTDAPAAGPPPSAAPVIPKVPSPSAPASVPTVAAASITSVNAQAANGPGAIVPVATAPATIVLAAAAPPTTTWAGLFDAYYAYNLKSPGSTATKYRSFDSSNNQFSLSSVELSLKHKSGDATFVADFDFGPMADAMSRDASGATDEVGKNIGQAYVTYSPSTAPALSVSVGKMLAYLGWETAKAKDDWNYSRSYVFGLGLPGWNAGANVGYTIAPDVLTITASVYNGWNTLNAANSGKTLAAMVAFTPAPGFTVTYDGIGGPEQKDVERYRKIVHDFNAQWTLNATISLAVDAAKGTTGHDALPNGTVGDAVWSGVLAAVKVALTPALYVSPRIERYWDPQGYTSGTAQTLSEGTLTFGYALTDGLETRIEARHDSATVASFPAATGTADTQATLTVALLCSF